MRQTSLASGQPGRGGGGPPGRSRSSLALASGSPHGFGANAGTFTRSPAGVRSHRLGRCSLTPAPLSDPLAQNTRLHASQVEHHSTSMSAAITGCLHPSPLFHFLALRPSQSAPCTCRHPQDRCRGTPHKSYAPQSCRSLRTGHTAFPPCDDIRDRLWRDGTNGPFRGIYRTSSSPSLNTNRTSCETRPRQFPRISYTHAQGRLCRLSPPYTRFHYRPYIPWSRSS